MNEHDPGYDDAAACGCCAGPHEEPLTNRPGLPAVRYRVGTHASFLRRMLARLPAQTISGGENEGVRPLQALTTRAVDDASIALLDAWAVVGDVLTFYQERIANEGFLRTALQRRSVLELARAIGYELSPGVAASTFLAFTVEEPVTPGGAASTPELRALQSGPGMTTAARAVVPAGTPVKSVPGPEERPQTFETSAPLEARVEWNALRPRLTQPQPLDPDAASLWVEGIVSDVKAGSWLLFVLHGGDPGAAEPDIETVAKRVVAVTADDAQQRTRIDLADAGTQPSFTPPLRATLHFQLPVLQLPSLPIVAGKLPLSQATAGPLVMQAAWKQKDLAAFLGLHRWPPRALNSFARTIRRRRAIPPRPSFDLDTPEPGLHAFTVRGAAFGHNAPRHGSLPAEQRTTGAMYANDWDTNVPSIAHDSQREPYITGGSNGTPAAHLYFERVVPEVLPAGWLLAEASGRTLPMRVEVVQEASLADFALSGRSTGVVAQHPDGRDAATADFADFPVRSTTLHAGSRPLALAALPIEDDIGADTAEAAQLTLDALVLDLEPGRPLALTGERADLPGVLATEIVVLDEAIHSEGLTTLFFRSALRHPYLRRTVTISANVVEATHGESVSEVLGSGSGAVANPRFTLKRPPLTHVSAEVASGIRSTLEIRVNELRWEEAASLHRMPAEAHVYTIRIDDDSRASVIFGDGVHGARLPTGSENVFARYRSGIGREGEVDAGALSIMQSKPLGVRDVTNPVPATGGADPENHAAARVNAPRTVRTLERIVSLDDYADFARGFAGVGKAEASSLWDGYGRVVAVTIASAAGEEVDESSALFRTLEKAIAAARAGFEPFRLTSFRLLTFNVDAHVLVHPAHEAPDVLARAEAALRADFGFARRGFGRSVSASAVIAAMHGVAGVEAVDIDALHLVTDEAAAVTLASVIPARPARWEAGSVEPAELLLVNPVGITLREMES